MKLDLDRRTLILSVLAVTALAARVDARPEPPVRNILFVCQYGTVKSPIARELLRRQAARRGLQLSVRSRGITPGNHLPQDLRDRLAKDAISPDRDPLVKLAPADLHWADLVVLFDPLPSDLRSRSTRDWTGVPSMVKDYAKARPDLDRRIGQLLDDIARTR